MTMPSIVDFDEEFGGTKVVEERDRLDEIALARWMKENVSDYEDPLALLQFKGGQSNPTYRINTPHACYVLRRKPFGQLLASAHAIDREYRVITALKKRGFAVPDALGFCADDSVIGSSFYIMSMVEGRVFWNQRLPNVSREERRALYVQQIQTLAKLHNYDPQEIGLGGLGAPGNYFSRQVDRWTKQYRASEIEKHEDMDRLIDWLPKSLPVQQRVSVVHGDYRLDNIIFAADKPLVAAVLDWELSTIGDPLADFSYLLMQWVSNDTGRASLYGANCAELNVPNLEEAIDIYCNATGRSGMPDLNWLFAYNMFRLASILQGIAARVRDGTASSARAREAATRVAPMARQAWRYAVAAGAE